MVYKPNKKVMDLIMPEARKRGIVPQKIIDEIILGYFESGAKEAQYDKDSKPEGTST
jgi:hypothetical protein